MDPNSLIELLPAILWQGDARSRRFTWVSHAAEALLGYPAARWLEPDFWPRHLHPDDAWVAGYKAERMAAGLAHSCEYRMIAADGRIVWLRDTVGAALEDGRMHGVMVDVSDRRAAEEKRDEIDAVLGAVFQHAPVGLALFDRELRVVRINDRMALINGLSAEDTLGKRMRDLLPEVAERVEPIVRSVFDTGERVEGMNLSGETAAEPGRTRYWLASYYPIRAGAAEVRAVGALVIDVTDVREAEDALRKSESRYRYLYQRTPAMMHSIDHDGRIVDVSDTWLQGLGYARDEVVGHASTDFLTEASREYALTKVLPVFFATGTCRDVQYQIVRKDGAILDILLSAEAVYDAEGNFERSLAVLVDVTERKRAEEALRRSEARLLQAEKLEAIGRLAGGVAHDFNNLLGIILGYAESLLDQLEDPALRGPVESIARAGERAGALTRQILTFSRQQVVEPKVLDLNDVVLDVETLLRRLVRGSVEVSFDLRPSLRRIRMDPAQATQVLMNLVVNASDAMPEGGRLSIQTADADLGKGGPCEPGAYVLLSVSDTGVGMDAETIARIFEPFFTTKEAGRGTGLGLSIVYGVVRQSGGCVTVVSEPGKGTTFRVYFPRVEGAARRRTSA